MKLSDIRVIRKHARAAVPGFALLALIVPSLLVTEVGNSSSLIAADKSIKQKEGGESAGPVPKYKPDEVLVRFRPGVGRAEAAAAHARVGAQLVRAFARVRGLQLARLPKDVAVEHAIRMYRQMPNVLYAEPNYRLQAAGVPNDPSFSDLWGLDNFGQAGGTPDADIDAPEAWNITTGSSNVVVAVIDTGVDYNHPDLAANIWANAGDCDADNVDDDGNGWVDDCHGIDTYNWDSDPLDDHGHGTHVSGTIGAVGDNGVGVAGVNWNVKLMACKFLSAGGYGWTDGAISCLDYIAMMKDGGVNIVATNNSWGGGGFSQALLDAIDVQREMGILFIAAAGNSYGTDRDAVPFYPATYYAPNILSVAATDRFDGLAYFSDLGRHTVHLGAPGHEILSTTPDNTYSWYSGTSMATPHVTGVAALLKAQDPNRDWRAIKNLILAGGDTISSLTNTITQKRLNAYGALTCSNSVVLSRLLPKQNTVLVGPSEAVDLSVLHINCAAPNGQVEVTVDPGGEIITLLDNGVEPDQQAGDGIYSGQFYPPSVGTYTLTSPGMDTFTVNILYPYYFAETDFNYRSITGTSLDLWDDGVGTIAPPFSILFGGGNFSQLFVSDNGAISFGPGYISYWNESLPTPQYQTLVAPFWDDLLPYSGSKQNVFWDVIGTAPNRELVIEWRDIRYYYCQGDPSSTLKFQAVFFENKNDVLFNYADTVVGGGCSGADDGASATVGIQIGPSVATQFSFLTPSVHNNMSLLWKVSTVRLEPSSLNLGEEYVGMTTSPQTVTLTNVAATPLSISSIQTTGDFARTNNCGSSVPGGGSCTITVTFTPTALGTRTGTLSVVDTGIGSPHLATLSGKGVSFGWPGLSTYYIDFGVQGVTTTSDPQPVVITNYGSGPLGIGPIEIIPYPPTSPGTFAQTNNCPPSLAVGTSCTVSVTYSPPTVQYDYGELRIHDDGSGSPASVWLYGQGSAVVNDFFVDAMLVSHVPFTHAVNTTSAMIWDGQDPSPSCAPGRYSKSVWYSFTPPSNGRVRANTFGSNYDTVLSAYTGVLYSFVEQACNDDAADDVQSEISFNVTAGVTYSFMVSSYWDDGGDLVFNLAFGARARPDFDADGLADIGVWRPSNGVWYGILSSTGTPASMEWGALDDIPVATDYDGDGKSDVAVWRPSNGFWYVIPSGTGTPTFTPWGTAGDIPVPGDFDGDGKSDVAVWRPSNGVWYVIPSSTGTPTSTQWGTVGDIPVATDYDGDGKSDVAVWRPSNGVWYIIPSSTGTPTGTQWGTAGDIPLSKPLGQ